MKKKILILLVLIVVMILSFVVPIKKEKMWINDDSIADIGHYEIHYKNVYGFILKRKNER